MLWFRSLLVTRSHRLAEERSLASLPEKMDSMYSLCLTESSFSDNPIEKVTLGTAT